MSNMREAQKNFIKDNYKKMKSSKNYISYDM